VAIHNGPREPPFARRFRRASGVIDLIMFQTWGTTGEKDSWLAAGIEDNIATSLKDWKGAFIFAEYGYERNPDLELKVPGHRYMNSEHTRRGAWRGAFSGTGIIHGFENTWGPWWIPGKDQEGMKYLVILKGFFTNTVEFHRFKPETEIIDQSEQYEPGTRPLYLSTSEKDAFLVYLPAGGNVSVNLSEASDFESFWFNPRTGGVKEASKTVKKEITRFTREDKNDWVLILREKR
ncbi:MAG: putative collagen-binding domain-containing protein, partial [Candidatus Bathyarchaeia archaeon]